MDAAGFYLRKSASVTVIAGAVSAVAGILLGLAQDESIMQWAAYGLEFGGGILIAFALLTAQPSAKRKVRERLLGAPQTRPVADALLFVPIGIVLIAAGTLVELSR